MGLEPRRICASGRDEEANGRGLMARRDFGLVNRFLDREKINEGK
jgi:hypothetical protein